MTFPSAMKSLRLPRDAEVNRQSKSPSHGIEFQSTMSIASHSSPFPVDFFMLRLNLMSNFTKNGKIIHLGLCMPTICTDNDILNILKSTSQRQSYIGVEVETVRSHHNRFEFWLDRTFITLCIITSFTLVMLFIGTAYDFYLEHLREQKKIANTYTLTSSELKLDTAQPDIKSKNGKHGVYIINKADDPRSDSLTVSTNHPNSNKKLLNLIVRELLLSFSVRINLRIICDQSVGSDTIPVIHGLKAISMIWVILGHTCIVVFKYSDNMEFRKSIEKDFLFQTISSGAFSVDTFFFISGLLVSFLYFRTNAKGKLDPLTNGMKGFSAGFIHFLGLLFYRLVRLSVPYLISLGVVEVVMKWFHHNSVFEVPALDHENCPKYWWRNILYINTLFPVDEMCMLWSWYLSNDTQFYIVGAIILILSTKHFKIAASVLLTLLTSSWLTTSYIAFSNSHKPGSDDPLALFDKIYDKPWTRLGPYLIGMCAGWILFKKNCQIYMSRLTFLAGWALSIGCLIMLVYGLYESDLSPIAGAAYSSLSHSAWALSLGWIVVACSTGYGGIINEILSAPILYPFSRVTYCAYLLHPIGIRVMAMCMDSPFHLDTIVTIVIFLGQVVASFALSFFLSLAFEAPIVSMLRIMQKIVDFKKKQRENSSITPS
ncbi:hypothetical protein WA026_007576 [Henosepilachna vigintioctopunctata]|uniref:Acyltransferase 3 domain-containing protein n=1 Tax=Henosepilachna vigintioctopunctata TaxID=420089 RepID=A0AAW1UY13_9CUCU